MRLELFWFCNLPLLGDLSVVREAMLPAVSRPALSCEGVAYVTPRQLSDTAEI